MISSRAMERLISDHEAEYGEMLIEYCNAGCEPGEARRRAQSELEARYGRGGADGALAADPRIAQWVAACDARRRAMTALLELNCPPGCYPDYALRDMEREAARQVRAGIPLPALDALRHLLPFAYRPQTADARAWLERVLREENLR